MLFKPSGSSGHLRVTTYFFQMYEHVSKMALSGGIVDAIGFLWFNQVRSWMSSIMSAKVSEVSTEIESTDKPGASDLCPFLDMKTSAKLAINYLQPLLLCSLVLIAYILVHIHRYLPHRIHTRFGTITLKKEMTRDINPEDPDREKKLNLSNLTLEQRFRPRFGIAWIRLAQYSYATICSTTLALLNCVPIQQDSVDGVRKYINVLYVEGDIQCTTWYQWILFFTLVPLLILFPFFLGLYPWWIRRTAFIQNRQLTIGEEAALLTLEGPFTVEKRWWESIIIGV
jgi:hypothetical protein